MTKQINDFPENYIIAKALAYASGAMDDIPDMRDDQAREQQAMKALFDSMVVDDSALELMVADVRAASTDRWRSDPTVRPAGRAQDRRAQ